MNTKNIKMVLCLIRRPSRFMYINIVACSSNDTTVYLELGYFSPFLNILSSALDSSFNSIQVYLDNPLS